MGCIGSRSPAGQVPLPHSQRKQKSSYPVEGNRSPREAIRASFPQLLIPAWALVPTDGGAHCGLALVLVSEGMSLISLSSRELSWALALPPPQSHEAEVFSLCD
ncbi:hypothetical protein J1605_019163 [Eschrichtius robustus]|uniref:Uncharacterized protein n=1 Tax=Eschrichtius robustus TaxID=9764 RepID=A0AB34HR14_ESCRO|nr:hypothetical protein J1605_019163 [Eschrichtius robustus]